MEFQTWIVLFPLLPAIALIVIGILQLVKEVRPLLDQVKSLQKEILRVNQVVSISIPVIQSMVMRASEEAQNGQALLSESKQAYDNVRNILTVLRGFDTLPVRRGIRYIRRYLQERRLPASVRYLKVKARELSKKFRFRCN